MYKMIYKTKNSTMFHTLQIIPIYLAWIVYPFQFALLFYVI
jgi:hypothetical protein